MIGCFQHCLGDDDPRVASYEVENDDFETEDETFADAEYESGCPP
jgi:hypothetical protein